MGVHPAHPWRRARGVPRVVQGPRRSARPSGHRLDLVQANASVSAKGVLRGIHFADVPPGQAKYVTCVKGSVLDVIVDIRVGSPTFGQWTSVLLDDRDRRAVYLSEGLGHGFCSLEDGSTVVYLCSEGYNPSGEHEVHPLDPAIGIDWPLDGVEPELSAKDAAAPTSGRGGGGGPAAGLRGLCRPPRRAWRSDRRTDACAARVAWPARARRHRDLPWCARRLARAGGRWTRHQATRTLQW